MSETLRLNDHPVYNGLFGVRKGWKEEDNGQWFRTLRLIVNLIPSNNPDPGAGPKSGSPNFLGGSIGSKYLGRVQMAKRDPTQNDRFCQNAELIWAVSFRKAAI